MAKKKIDLQLERAERLRFVLDTMRVTHTYIAKHLKVSRQSVTKWLVSGRISHDHLQGFARLTLFCEEWLRSGQGPQRLSAKSGEALPERAQIAVDLWRALDEQRQHDMLAIMHCLLNETMEEDDDGRERREIDLSATKQPGPARRRASRTAGRAAR